MFTGIIEAKGIVKSVTHDLTNLILTIESPISNEFKIDQSVSHNGVCLTVDQLPSKNQHRCTLIHETLMKTNFGQIKVGDQINLERSLLLSSRLDGHFVQGHVDTTSTCLFREDLQGSWLFKFKLDPNFAHLIVSKGSICINGVSLTVSHLDKDTFGVSIIPYTFDHTNFGKLSPDDKVNIEYDIFGKYIARMKALEI